MIETSAVTYDLARGRRLSTGILAIVQTTLLAAGCRPAADKGSGAPVAAPVAFAVADASPGAGGHQGEPAAASALSPPAAVPTVTIATAPRPVSFYVQVAATPEERANGLIGRPTLASDAGLLVVFDRLDVQTMLMKDTLVPLDLIFIGSDRRIVGIIEKTRPRSSVKYRIAVLSRYVLGIQAGLASRLGLRPGQTVELGAIPGV